MTKKDYELIASTLKFIGASGGTDKITFLHTAEALAASLQTANPKFARTKFLTACGIQH